MKSLQTHDCEQHAKEYVSSQEAPYHYVNSGLSNVYLVGVKYRVCEKCDQQSADIPAVKHLMTALARAVVNKAVLLTGEEVRFLRKRLARRSVEFAKMLSMTAQRFSELEAGRDRIAPDRDKLVRMIYKILSGDRKLITGLSKPDEFERWITSIHGDGASERVIATWMQNHQWKVESTQLAA
jgi:DNA-binding transcriptional regulator YiaG